LKGAVAKAIIYDLNGKEVPAYGQTKQVDVAASNIAEAFSLNFNPFEIDDEKPKEIDKPHPISKSHSPGIVLYSNLHLSVRHRFIHQSARQIGLWKCIRNSMGKQRRISWI